MKWSGATFEHSLGLTEDRAAAAELLTGLTLHLEPGTASTTGKGDFTSPPLWPLTEQLRKLVRGTG